MEVYIYNICCDIYPSFLLSIVNKVLKQNNKTVLKIIINFIHI